MNQGKAKILIYPVGQRQWQEQTPATAKLRLSVIKYTPWQEFAPAITEIQTDMLNCIIFDNLCKRSIGD